jgi:protein-L-isoaspartate O-methyltransferase
VTAVEIDPGLAQRASENLALGWPQARVIATDGFLSRSSEPADAIVVNAGVTHISLAWLDCLAAGNGRLLVPVTNADRWGSFLMTRRDGWDGKACHTRRTPRTTAFPTSLTI